MNATVEVVVTNWKREGNIGFILNALKNQLGTCSYVWTLIDASGFVEPYDCRIHSGFSRVFRVPNMGSWNRLALCGAFVHDYTLFLDDDVIPGPHMVESFVAHAQNLKNRFSCLGLTGRRYAFNQVQFVDKVSTPEWCEWLSRVYFLQSRDLHWAVREAHRCGLTFPFNHDDVMMGMGISRNTGQPCYVVPEMGGMEWNTLDSSNAVSKEEGYEKSLVETIGKLKT